MSLSPDGALLAVIHFSGRLSVWDVPSLKQRTTWGQDQQVRLPAFGDLVCAVHLPYVCAALDAWPTVLMQLLWVCSFCMCVCAFNLHVSGRSYAFAEYNRQHLCACSLLVWAPRAELCVHDASVNRVSRLISAPLPPHFFFSLSPSVLRSCPQPGFDEINPEWKTSLERRKKIKGALAWRAKEPTLLLTQRRVLDTI